MIVRKRHAIVAAITVAVFFAAGLWGCETQSPEKKKAEKPFIGVLAYRQNDAYVTLVTDAIRKTLENKAEVEIVYAEDNQSLQNSQLDTLLRKGCKGLLLNIANPQAGGTVVDAIKRAGIPVVFFNREPDLDSIKSYYKARFVGTNILDAGVMQGDSIKDLWTRHPQYDKNKDKICQYLMIQADLDNPEAVARTEYSVKQARENGVAMQQVEQTLLCNWEKKLAYEDVRLLFPQHEDEIELIIANNDAMALGAIQALAEYGYNREGGNPKKFIPVVGVDAVPEAIEAIRKGIMSATVRQDSDAMGKTVATMILNAVNGKDFLADIPYAPDKSGIAVRIPYSRYEADR